ncbi:tol-pal system protein YbgF [Gemmobacter caeni]|uniref:Cell division coordinator CpoB n=1 Tax=Gemmobacter caeni TaxID=589035 RepID=A0A2T6AVY2_9RHOB|nr:tol-pal system protein YbgF [Gemmobacter caeni]PTX47970.1 tol-pal system protein YbgF [Gemmobacter caeni]TWI97308.1 tol-pal system protein YbgF [Gemmobacter caeni]
MRLRFAALALLLMSGSAIAQDRAQSLADIKAELAALNAEFTGLKQELITTGAIQNGAAGGNALQRLDSIEAALTRLTAQTEQVELKVNRVVTDGTNRLGDLEFRVTELEGGDVGSLPPTQPLGGGNVAAPVVTAPTAGGPELAVGEQADFDRAKEVLGQGDFRTAAEKFGAFASAYPGSPLMQEAQILRGDALQQAGDTVNAARAWLDAFSAQPEGPKAGDALVRLGQGLADLGQVSDACVTLQEVGTRFPGSTAATEAQGKIAALACQ